MKQVLTNIKNFFFNKEGQILKIYTKIYNNKISNLNIEYFIEKINKDNYHIVYFFFKSKNNSFYDFRDVYKLLYDCNFKETKLYNLINNNNNKLKQ